MCTTSEFNFSKFRTKNTDTINFNGNDYILFEKLQSFVSFYIPPVINGGGYLTKKNCLNPETYGIDNRYFTIMQLTVNFLYLNPEARKEDIYRVLKMLNHKCKRPLNDVFLNDMLEELTKLKEDSQLQPVKNLQRHYLINPKITKENKHSVMGVANGELKKQKTLNELKIILANWGFEKYSNSKLATKASLHIGTIESYTPKLRDEIAKIKLRKSKPKENKTLSKLKSILLKWNLDKGLPTYKDIAAESGFSEDTVKRYGHYLKPIKEKLKIKKKKRLNKYPFFAPFDGSYDDIVNETNLKTA